ncbi:hypothetical protein LINPERHAP1_LOCUS18617 [Linum perenne]
MYPSDKLPVNIIDKIATEHLHAFTDLISFSGVCTQFRSAVLDPNNIRFRRRRPCLPGLLFSVKSEFSYSRSTRFFCGAYHEFVPPVRRCELQYSAVVVLEAGGGDAPFRRQDSKVD